MMPHFTWRWSYFWEHLMNLIYHICYTALGNWSGKQRREERLGQLDQFKKVALERVGFTFDTVQQAWDNFLEKLQDYTSKHGKIPNFSSLKALTYL